MFLLGLLAVLAPAGHADDSLEALLNLSLDDLANYQVITATKTELRLADAPGSVTVITHEQIQSSPASTIPELLRSQAGINVRWNPMVQTIDIRSFGSNPFTNRVLLLIDGVPYNSWNKGGFPQHPGFDFFNLDIVKHIEIVRGAGSSLYGENAFNGVVNIITLDGTEGTNSRLKYTTGSMSGELLSASFNKDFGPDRAVFGALRYTKGQIPTELWFDESDADARGYDIYLKSKFDRFRFSYYRRQDNFEGFEHEVGGNFPVGTVFRSAEQIRQSVNIFAAGYEQEIAAIKGDMTANLSFANRNGSHCASCHAPNQSESFDKSEDHGYQTFGNAQLNSTYFAGHKLSAGFEWRKISSGNHAHELLGGDVGHSSTNPAIETVQSYQKHAVFLQDQWSSKSDRLMVTMGMRYESGTSPKLFRDQWFPRASVVFKATDRMTLRSGWHRAARYPSFSELYQNSAFVVADTPGPDIALADFVPNPGLQPERIESIEAGADYRFGDRLQGSVQLYKNRIDRAIIIAYPAIRFENHTAGADVHGLELTLHANPWDWLDASFNWSLQNESQIGDGVDSAGNSFEFTYAPKHKVNLSLAATPTANFQANLDINWKSETLAPSFWYGIVFGDPTPRPLDSFAYVNMRVAYQPPWLKSSTHRPLTLSLALKNLTNERPYETLTGFGGRNAGRSGYLSIEYRWGNE